MDALGIEIKKDSWEIVHAKATLFGVKAEKRFALEGRAIEQNAGELSAYIADNGLKGAGVAVLLPRTSTITRVLEIPAPNASAIGAILAFELEKHLPFSPDEAYCDHSIIGKDKNLFTVLVAAARKSAVDELAAGFKAAGIERLSVGAWQAAFFDSLYWAQAVTRGKKTAFVSIGGEEAAVDAFNGFVPVYSRTISLGGRAPSALIDEIKRELRFSRYSLSPPSGERSIDECVLITRDEPDEGLLAPLSEGADCVRAAGHKEAMPAFGAALGAFERARLGIDLAPTRQNRRYARTLMLAAAVFALALFTGFSYIIKDWITGYRLNAAISRVKAEKDKVEGLADEYRAIDSRIRALEAVKGESGPGGLDILKELTELLPKDTWLTGLEYEKGMVTIEGFSGSASTLLLKAEGSVLFKDFEFTGPVTKAAGKERFRMRFAVAKERLQGR